MGTESSAVDGCAEPEVDGAMQSDGVPTVVFLCTHNAGRSQMALGWFTHLAGGRAVGVSGGSQPALGLHAAAVGAMAEVGIDISAQSPAAWTPEMLGAADVVITMGCGESCPVVPGVRYEDWEVEDPAGKSLVDVRPIRDEIERRVRGLLARMGIENTANTAH
jgi:protein-tyrosine-phosphatase